METIQTLLTSELPQFKKAIESVNSLFGTMVSIEEINAAKGITTVKIMAVHSQAFFAVAVQYGRNIEAIKLKEYITVMMEEAKD